jgi:6-phosphogluconolactonase
MTNWNFLRAGALGALAATSVHPTLAADAGAKPLPVLIGTYTTGASKGIYTSEFNPATGQLTAPTLAAESKNPAFLALHPNGRFVYAVAEIAAASGVAGGVVAAFAREAATGKLTPLNQQPSGGAGPCHLTVDRTGQCLLVANYGSGSLAALAIQADGSLAAPATTLQHRGASVNPSRQSSPHAHQVVTDPANRFALVCDLGLDKILVYRLNAPHATLTPNAPPFATVKPGSGPRHLAFHPNGHWVYLLNEMAATITVFTWNAAHGLLTELESVATLPSDFSGPNSAAELVVHPSGKVVFASNRGHDSVAVLAVDAATGRLQLRQNQGTKGKAPRFIGLDPSGRWLLAANQSSENIVVFPFDAAAGRLGESVQTIAAPSPVCLLFPTAPTAPGSR